MAPGGDQSPVKKQLVLECILVKRASIAQLVISIYNGIKTDFLNHLNVK